jgi:hypothetical protein
MVKTNLMIRLEQLFLNHRILNIRKQAYLPEIVEEDRLDKVLVIL